MSDLTPNYENAYGIAHNWKNVKTHQWGAYGGVAHSHWECLDCKASFIHYYHNIPDIHEQMKFDKVPEECIRRQPQEDDGA